MHIKTMAVTTFRVRDIGVYIGGCNKQDKLTSESQTDSTLELHEAGRFNATFAHPARPLTEMLTGPAESPQPISQLNLTPEIWQIGW
jgi:hypothetical protein